MKDGSPGNILTRFSLLNRRMIKEITHLIFKIVHFYPGTVRYRKNVSGTYQLNF